MFHRSLSRGTRARLGAWCCLALALVPAALTAQDVRPTDRERGRTMLRQMAAHIQQHYYDPTLRGIDVDARVAVLDSVIREATTLADVFGAVALLPMEFNDSHTFFVPPRQRVSVDYGWEMRIVGDSAYVSRVDAGSDAERQGVRVGDRVLTVNGYAPSRRNLWHILYVFNVLRPQPGLFVEMQPPGAPVRGLNLAARVRQRSRIAETSMDLYQLIREAQNEAEELRYWTADLGDVVVWKMPTFDAELRTLRDALRRTRGKRALVLDMRGNAGGSVAVMTELLDGLSTEPLPVGMLRERGRETPLASRGNADAFTGELVVLVDSESASAAEVVARVVQLAGRGVVLGDRTAGAVMRGRMEMLTMGAELVVSYGVSVTDADLVMSDGGRLEGAGVTPDEIILPGAGEMAAGEDPVLSVALERLGISMDPAAAGALFRGR